MEKFKSFITEEEKSQSYRFVIIYNDPENMTDDSKAEAEEMAVDMIKFGSELGLKGFKCRIEDAYISHKNDKMYIHDIDDKVTGHLESSNYKNCIAHRTGHGLGMDVHEDPYVTRGNNQKLEEGMVITIEPGLYDLGNVGVRIEDNILITPQGPESLTILPRELLII